MAAARGSQPGRAAQFGIAIGLSGAVYEPRAPPPQFEAQQLHADRKIFPRAGDGVAVVASRGRPIIESAAAFAALINTPSAKSHEVVNRPVSWHAINCVGAAYRADVSSGRNSHNTASEVTRRGGHSTLIFNQKLAADCGDRITREGW